MSTAKKEQLVDVVLCDYCGETISESLMKYDEWVHLIKDEQIDKPKGREKWYIFRWHAPTRTIRYDFHAVCFDKMVRKVKETNNV